MTHLDNTTSQLLDKSDDHRIAAIHSERWIGYPRAKDILEKFNELLKHPKVLRMPCLLLIGATNNGKTSVMHRFFSTHKPVLTTAEEKLCAPVIYIQAPAMPEPHQFYNTLLNAVNAPYKTNDSINHKHHRTVSILSKVGLQMLIIDEVHHILAGPYYKQRVLLNVIKYLANELQIVIVGAGIKEAYNAINTDPQMANRFEPALLPRWQMDDEYLRLLASYESVLPLRKPSHLYEPELAMKILVKSEGIIGEMSTILRKAAVQAIKNKEECINPKTLEEIKYISPLSRKKQFETLQ